VGGIAAIPLGTARILLAIMAYRERHFAELRGVYPFIVVMSVLALVIAPFL
jgi:hypothetical protein